MMRRRRRLTRELEKARRRSTVSTESFPMPASWSARRRMSSTKTGRRLKDYQDQAAKLTSALERLK